MRSTRVRSAAVALALAWLAAAVPLSRVAFAQTRPVLRGFVTDAGGAPIRGATVMIYTAGPKKGTSPL